MSYVYSLVQNIGRRLASVCAKPVRSVAWVGDARLAYLGVSGLLCTTPGEGAPLPILRGLGRGDAGRPTTCELRRIAFSLVVMLSPRVAATFDARDRWPDDPDAIPSGTWRLSEGGGPPPGGRFTALDRAEDPT